MERLDQRIQELASGKSYHESVQKLVCFKGIHKTTALAVLVEVGDFKRFPDAQHLVSYIGLVPGEDSSVLDRLDLGSSGYSGPSVWAQRCRPSE